MKILLAERINSANQYVEELAKAYQAAGHEVIFDVQNFLFSSFLPDVVHIQWPEAIYKWRHKLKATEAKDLIRERLEFYTDKGVPIVYTAHNLLPHGTVSDLDQEIYELVMSYVDVVIHHGSRSIELLKDRFQFKATVKHVIAPHGPYVAEQVAEGAARKSFQLPKDRMVYLNFGRIRPNKGFDFTNAVFRKFAGQEPFLFTIGPKLMSRKERIISKLKDKIPGINQGRTKDSLTVLRDISHDEISYIFSATDVVFMGHLEGLNSGVLAQAISQGKPVVYPDLGNFREQAEGWEWQRVYEPGNVDSAAKAIREMNQRITEMKAQGMAPSNALWLEKNSWGHHVNQVLEAVSA